MVTTSFIHRLSHAVDLIEKRSQQDRPLKVVRVRRGPNEDGNVALDRHFAPHPEDRDANIVIFNFFGEGVTSLSRWLIPDRFRSLFSAAREEMLGVSHPRDRSESRGSVPRSIVRSGTLATRLSH